MSFVAIRCDIQQASERPCVITLIRQGDLLTRLSADFARHHLVAARLWMLTVPDWRVGSISRPRLIKIYVRPVGDLMKTCAVHVDDADGGLPVADVLVVHEPAKENQHVARLRPRWFEIPVTRCKRFVFGSAEHVDVDFAVLVVRRAVTFLGIGRCRDAQRGDEDCATDAKFATMDCVVHETKPIRSGSIY